MNEYVARVRQYGWIIFLAILLTVTGPVLAEDYSHIYEVLNQIDTFSNFGSTDFSAVMTMITEEPEKGIERLVVRQFRRDESEQYLLLIQEPSVQRGQGYLLDGDNLWFYDPSSRRFSHTSLKEAFQGSDARNSDFSAWTFTDDYDVGGYTEDRLGKYDVYVIDLVSKHDTVTYPYMKLWVTKDTSLVLKSEDYSLTKRLMRTSLYPSYARIGDRMIPRQMVFVDELVQGQRTQITLSELSINPIPDHVFTQSYLERVNR